jgi:hypothetical protein
MPFSNMLEPGGCDCCCVGTINECTPLPCTLYLKVANTYAGCIVPNGE